MKNLKCPSCGKDLKLVIGYTGADWNCEAGEDSGFGHEISLDCENCGNLYPIGYVKKASDFSPTLDKSFKMGV